MILEEFGGPFMPSYSYASDDILFRRISLFYDSSFTLDLYGIFRFLFLFSFGSLCCFEWFQLVW